MSSKIRDCVKNLEKNKNVEQLLPEYVEQYMAINGSYARIKMMMEYYMFYETVSEGINPYLETVKETVQTFNEMVECFFEKNPSKETVKQMAEQLLALRKEVVERMDVLTAYVDCFVVYEYILNRVQYRFEDQEMMPDDTVFAQDLVNFIFSGKDNVAVNDNIRFAIGQLPMRMTRGKYFDLIRESVSVYKGSDKSSLDGFVYMFRTNAMLYHQENKSKYFQEFAKVLEELEALDYETITEELYEIYSQKIQSNATKLNDVSDLYMQLGQLINEMYIICMSSLYASKEEGGEAERVIRGICGLFMGKDGDVWKQAREVLSTEEEKLDWLGTQFVAMEGKQEQLYESLTMAGAALENISEAQAEHIAQADLTEAFAELGKMFLLTSNSVFAELEKKEEEQKVTEKMAEEVTAQLIEECKVFFKGKSRMLRRAVMANTLEKMPVFFGSAQEVADYVMTSLSQCEDSAEKYAAKQLLMDVMK